MKTKKIAKNYLDLILVPNQKWHKEENIVVLDVENQGFFNSISQKFFKQPKISHISLDNYGSTLWLLLDGNNTVLDVVNKMKNAFPSEENKMLNRVITFFHTLQVNKYIVEKN